MKQQNRLSPESLRVCRVNIGLTQGRLARLAGVSSGLIGQLERDEKDISEEIEVKLREALGLSDDEITDIMLANKRVKERREITE